MIPPKEMIGRLQNACANTVDGLSMCHIHDVGNRCLFCQAAWLIEHTMFGSKMVYELADLRAENEALKAKLAGSR